MATMATSAKDRRRPTSTRELVDRLQGGPSTPRVTDGGERRALLLLACGMAAQIDETSRKTDQGWVAEAAALVPVLSSSLSSDTSPIPSSSHVLSTVSSSSISPPPSSPNPSHSDVEAQEMRMKLDAAYGELVRGFTNTITNTVIGFKDPIVFELFPAILRCMPSGVKAEFSAGSAIKGLHEQIEAATKYPDSGSEKRQYRLVSALASTFDTMLDMVPVPVSPGSKEAAATHKATATMRQGLDREKVHVPILESLAALRDSPELRLSQAATRAYEALSTIPNNEGPFQKLCRHSSTWLNIVAKVAGGVTTIDPDKIYDGFATAVEEVDWQKMIDDIIDLTNTAIETGTAVKEAFDEGKGIKSLLAREEKGLGWYSHLRLAEVLVRGGRLDSIPDESRSVPIQGLVKFFDKLSRQPKTAEPFLCGLYALLEEAWVAAQDDLTKERITTFVDKHLDPTAAETGNPRVTKWMLMAGKTMHRLARTTEILKLKAKPESILRKFKNNILPRRSKRTTPDVDKFSDQVSCLNPWLPPGLGGSPGSILLDLAWEQCTPAQLFYADRHITEEYYLRPGSDRLKMQLLSGTSVSMDSCYINLRVTVQKQQGTNHFGVSRSTDGEVGTLPLEDLFAERELMTPGLGKTRRPPNRVLIRGQAGVGKTTLTKKMVDNFARKRSMWQDDFDRVLWVRLRDLKGAIVRDLSLHDWLRATVFLNADADDRDIFAKVVASYTVEDRTLFILDGLDEVATELDLDVPPALLEELLAKRRVVITSRPGTALSQGHFGAIDLELEALGFTIDQVGKYITQRVQCKDIISLPFGGDEAQQRAQMAEDIKSYLNGNDMVREMARIPILLDGICYGWNANPESQDSSNSSTHNAGTTMTELYYNVTMKLWIKDAERIQARKGKGQAGFSIKHGQRRTSTAMRQLIQPQLNRMASWAFAGFYRGVIVFNRTHQELLARHDRELTRWLTRHDGRVDDWDEEDLNDLSFVRSSDTEADSPGSPDYNFIHLTFQEFFAAWYFVEHWVAGKDLPRLNLDPSAGGGSRANKTTSMGAPPTPMPTEHLVRKSKFDINSNIFWRFVVGLLAKEDPKHLHKFFELLDDAPYDLLGPTRQRLIISCLSEVPSTFKTIRQPRENELKAWFEYECSLHRLSHAWFDTPDLSFSGLFVSDLSLLPEFPAQILCDLILDTIRSGPDLDSKGERVLFATLYSLADYRGERRIENVLDALVHWLRHLRPSTIDIFLAGMPLLVLHALEARAKQKRDSEVLLSRLNSLPGVAVFLERKVRYVRDLGDNDEHTKHLVLSLCHNGPRATIRHTLSRLQGLLCEILPVTMQKALVNLLSHPDPAIRLDAIKIFLRPDALHPSILQDLLARLDPFVQTEEQELVAQVLFDHASRHPPTWDMLEKLQRWSDVRPLVIPITRDTEYPEITEGKTRWIGPWTGMLTEETLTGPMYRQLLYASFADDGNRWCSGWRGRRGLGSTTLCQSGELYTVVLDTALRNRLREFQSEEWFPPIRLDWLELIGDDANGVEEGKGGEREERGEKEKEADWLTHGVKPTRVAIECTEIA